MAVLPAKAQKQGTCTFINRKSVIEGFLYVLEREKKIQDLLKHKGVILNELSKKELDKIDLEAQEYAQKQYKRFTFSMREAEINQRLDELAAIPQQRGDKELSDEEHNDAPASETETETDLYVYLDLFRSYVFKVVKRIENKKKTPNLDLESRVDNKDEHDLATAQKILLVLTKVLGKELIEEFFDFADHGIDFPLPDEKLQISANAFTTTFNLEKAKIRNLQREQLISDALANVSKADLQSGVDRAPKKSH